MEFYTYRYGAEEIPAKVAGETGLAPILVSALEVIQTSFLFAAALDSNDKAALDGFMADRGYTFYRQTQQLAAFRASSKMVNNSVIVPTSIVWAVLGGVVVDPSFFANNLAKIIGRITGNYKATGAGAEMRVVEVEAATGIETVLGSFVLPDSGGVFANVIFTTNVPPKGGENTYRLEARSNAVLDLEARFLTMVLLETP